MARLCALSLFFLSCFISAINSGNGAPSAPLNLFGIRMTRSLIDQSHSNVVASISRPKREIRSMRQRRSLTSKELQDPNNCIHNCWDADDELTQQVQTNFENRVHYTDQISENQNSQQSQIKKITDNMGSLLSDTCQAGRKTKSCLQACPNSQLKDVAVADYYVEDIACEPDKNFGGYNNYHQAVDCINNTLALSRGVCASKCGGDVKDLRAVTQLGIDRNESDSSNVYVESDVGKNVNAVRQQCKTTACNRDCNKNGIINKCGQKAFDFYDRQLKVEPRSALTILQKLGAINSVPQECSSLNTR